ATGIMFAPTAVTALRLPQPKGGTSEQRIAPRHSSRAQPFDRMKNRVGEIDAPEAGEGAVAFLAAAEEADAAGHRLVDPRSQYLRVYGPKMGEGRQRRAGAFHIGALRHALAEHLGRIHRFQEPGAAP